jgi:hypothetical protein
VGKRSRKQRGGSPRPAAEAEPRAAAPSRLRPAPDERPKAPWHPVPLVELCVLVGIVLIVIGFFSLSDRRGGMLIVLGLVLGSLGGLDTVVREHFAGFRSHSALLAGVPAVLAAGILFFARAPWIALVVAFVVIFAGAFAAFRRVFRRSTGGLSFR